MVWGWGADVWVPNRVEDERPANCGEHVVDLDVFRESHPERSLIPDPVLPLPT